MRPQLTEHYVHFNIFLTSPNKLCRFVSGGLEALSARRNRSRKRVCDRLSKVRMIGKNIDEVDTQILFPVKPHPWLLVV